MDRPRLSVLIVTWNCRALVGACLDHLAASVIDRAIEVIVVDNASTDGTAPWIREHHPAVETIDAGANLGFGRANNLAAERATGDYLLLLNPDAYLTNPGTLEALCRVLDADRSGAIASVAPMLINRDGSHQVGDAGFAPTIGNVVRHQWFVSKLVPGARGLYVNRPALLIRERVRVEWLAATCLMIRRSAFAAVGGFDPAFFMYGEDVDLGVRIHRTGAAQFLLPGLRVLHLQGATQRQNPETIHVSVGWIDAIFAQHRGDAAVDALRRHLLAASMTLGFLTRAVIYRIGGTGVAKSAAMLGYARHSWRSRR